MFNDAEKQSKTKEQTLLSTGLVAGEVRSHISYYFGVSHLSPTPLPMWKAGEPSSLDGNI